VWRLWPWPIRPRSAGGFGDERISARCDSGGQRIDEGVGGEQREVHGGFCGHDEEMAAKMTASSLAGYDGVVFNNTSGDLPLPDREGFLNWIKSGKGFAGFHAATDTLGEYEPYIEMIGVSF
jgi:hypothetical protein